MDEDDQQEIRFVPRWERNRVEQPPQPIPLRDSAPPKPVPVKSDLTDSERSAIHSTYTGDKPRTYRHLTPVHLHDWSFREDTTWPSSRAEKSLEVPVRGEDAIERPSYRRSSLSESAAEVRRRARIWRSDHDISILSRHRVDTPPLLHWNDSLPRPLCEVLSRNGYAAPLPVQSQCIPIALDGVDIVGLSQPGTGKTLAYVIPLVVRVMRHLEQFEFDPTAGPLAAILVPTHELAGQIARIVDQLCGPLGLLSFLLVGGFSITDQALQLRRGFHVLVATPGRLNDVLESHLMVLGRCSSIVIDEADKMIDRSLEPQIQRVLAEAPADRSLMMFSATMPNALLSIVEHYFANLVRIRVGAVGDASETIRQVVYYVQKHERKQAFLDNVHRMKPPILVFVNSRDACEDVGNLLGFHGFKVAALHGGKAQKDREAVVNAITDGIIDIVVATDVLARGIDIETVQNVVNFEVPSEISAYVHRIGRTGRAGQSGAATSFVTPEDEAIMYDLTRLLQRNGFAVPEAMLKNPAAQQKVETDTRRFEG